MKAAVVGGGGFRTPMVHAGLLSRAQSLPVGELWLEDLEPVRLERIAAVLRGQAEEAGGGPDVRLTTDLGPALDRADLVLCAVRVGGEAARAADERAALDLGLLGQETVGAAGILYGLRTVPVMRRLADEIARRAPRAWVLNFTNPAGLVTEAMMPALGERVIGVCDSPAAMVGRVAGALDHSARDLEVGYAGLNHFGWLVSVHDATGADLLPGLLRDPERLGRIEEARLFGTRWLHALGMIPNEYLFYYDRTAAAIAETVRRGKTRGEALLGPQLDFYRRTDHDPRRALQAWRDVRLGRERTYLQEAGAQAHVAGPLGDEGGYAEVALEVAEALTGGPPRTAILNVRNAGTLPALDAEAVVEVPCRVDGQGAQPLPQPPLPAALAARTALMKAIDRLVLEAALGGSRRALLQAFAAHPLCGGIDTAPRLVELAAAQRRRHEVARA
ncbi:MAG: 6-phospho-beta-glucosidase [Candidatus Dormibacteraeota bacterium]|nr:6-phospho-beta-glucosidase [Candidatus Dormibacteraeota bacterium]